MSFINKLNSRLIVEARTKVKKEVDAEIEQDTKDKEKTVKAKGVKDVSKLIQKKFILPQVGNNSKYRDQLKTILTHMKSTGDGQTKTTYLLAGDVGVGKTSFVNSISTLTGIPLVIIEAPHITQEHIINIPFLVIDGLKKREGNLTLDSSDGDFKVVQAESNLVTQLRNHKQKSKNEVEEIVNRSSQLKAVYEDKNIQRRLERIDGMFNSILFLDEYFRTASEKIRNVLRNILNGYIGNDRIPEGVYVIMASNVEDAGVDEIPENYDFQMMNFETPDKNDFFDYIKGKYVSADENGEPTDEPTKSGIHLKPEVFNTFQDAFGPEVFGKNDEEADVRLSPRRAEQIILYVDAMTPVKTEAEARALLTFIKTNLSNYITGYKFNGIDKIMNATKEIIKETSPEFADKIDKLTPFSSSDWKDSLMSEIEAKMRLGNNRSYVPVVSGDPGTGKTSIFKTIAKEKNMGLIDIDVSNLSPEDFTGMPIANTKGDEITTTFSEPPLFNLIMKEYNELIQEHKVEGRKYNIILLFDEISRTKPAVFNSMRKVLLEKEFSKQYQLPEDVMITGALNPSGTGTTELTSHTRDVLDIISTSAKFSDVIEFATKNKKVIPLNKELGFDATGIVGNIITKIAKDFATDTRPDNGEPLNSEESPFWWTVNGETFYISGREFTEAIANITSQMDDRLLDMDWDPNANYEDEDYDKFMQEALNVLAAKFAETLNMVVTKMKVSNFVPTLTAKIINTPQFKTAFSPMKERKTADEMPLDEILRKVNLDTNVLSKKILGTYFTYVQTPTQFGQEIARSLALINEGKSIPDTIVLEAKLLEKLMSGIVEAKLSNAFSEIAKNTIRGGIKSLLTSSELNILDVSDEFYDIAERLF